MEKYSEKRRVGNLSEDVAEMFLVKSGFKILGRNYLKKWGELDIIAVKDSVAHFIEVKSNVSHETNRDNVSRRVSQNVSRRVSQNVSRLNFSSKDFKIEVSRETFENDSSLEYRPEENIHWAKQKRMLRAIETYILEKNFNDDQEWQIDIITVTLDFIGKTATIRHIENVVFD